MNNAAHIYAEAFFNGLRPDPNLTIDQWADEYRMLSQKASAEPGRWRTDRTPYLREPMTLLSPSSPVQKVVLMAGAQLGKTELANNFVGYVIHSAPAPLMFVQPTIDMAKRLSKQRIAPLIEETPVLKELVSDVRARDSSNTMLAKEFPGGFMILTGANSPTGLRSTPIRFLLADEVDAWPIDAGGEGDPLQLAEKRTTTFARKKIYICSTPTVKDVSRIEREFLAGDQRRYFVPCPHCGHKQHLQWANLKWTDDDPQTAQYACEDCGALIDERHKTEMLRQGEWRPTAQSDGRVASFHINSLYSPLGWKPWSEIVQEFLSSKHDPSLLKTWVNTVLGECFEEDYSAKLGADELRSRVEFYEAGTMPARALIATAGVDVQDNRLAVVIRAWGRDEESWLVDHFEIFGDPSQPQIWKQLDEAIQRPIPHELAEPVKLSAVAIDSGGHFTHEVYNYCRDRKAWGVFAIKGQSQRNKPIIGKATKVDLNYRGRITKGAAEVYPVGSDTAKSTIYARLKLNEVGAGYYHFHAEVTEDYFNQLTAEKQITRYIKGFPVREWVKKSGARNEALDCEVYSFSALNWLYMRFNRRTIWDQFERALKIKTENKEEKAVELPKLARPSRVKPRSSNFVTGY